MADFFTAHRKIFTENHIFPITLSGETSSCFPNGKTTPNSPAKTGKWVGLDPCAALPFYGTLNSIFRSPMTASNHPDTQNRVDERGIPLKRVGVSGLRFPALIRDWNGPASECRSIVTSRLGVNLPEGRKGIHMSRLVRQFMPETGDLVLSANDLKGCFEQMVADQGASEGEISLEFTVFLERPSPIRGLKAQQAYDLCWAVSGHPNQALYRLSARIPVMTLCPCSQEISDYGAHSQRGWVTLHLEHSEFLPHPPLAELVALADKAASAPVYPLLKRDDERAVTMQAWDSPVFVEDLCRNILLAYPGDTLCQNFEVEIENLESIHEHNAYAKGKRHYREV